MNIDNTDDSDDPVRRRLAEVSDIADGLNPNVAEHEIGRARIEAYQAGLRFAVDYLSNGPGTEAEQTGIPRPRQ